MEERNEAFDSAIREKLSGHEPAVPHALWTRISAELNETEEIGAPATPQIQAPVATTPWWRAAAAAVVLTVGAASLLFAMQDKTTGTSTAATQPAANTTPAIPAVTVVKETPQVAVVATPAIVKKVVTPATQNQTPATDKAITADNVLPVQEANTPATDESLAAGTVVPASTLDLGNVPAFSLKRLSAQESIDDEITIIKSAPSKKKHGKHGADDETTRVIILNKKYDSRPDIRYQLPVRF